MPELRVMEVKNDSSIEVSKNSRGWTYSVKAYGSTDDAIRDKLRGLIQIAKQVVKDNEEAQGETP